MKTISQPKQLFMILAFISHTLFIAAQSNQYLHFDREDDFVILQDASQYISGTTELTITGWFRTDELAYGQGYMGFRIGSGTAEFYIIQLNNGVMECRLLSTTGLHEYVSPPNTAIPQVWQHYAWVYNGSSTSLYVNGQLNGSSPASGVFQGENVPFAIGKSILGGLNFVFGGGIDEVSAWNRALSQAEIQEMMDNELSGNEDGLQLYYKFNQGVPGGDNTSITHLISQIGNGERDAELMNFALMGETSNFVGDFDPGYQAISFPQIPNKLVSDPPFEIEATATSGLPVYFEVISGPAEVDGHVVTLTGEAGQVAIKATQPGNDEFDPAEPVTNHFMVLDPQTHLPEIDVRHPLAGNVYVPVLAPLKMSAGSVIDYPELFSVQNLRFIVNGETVYADQYEDGHFIGWWEPPSHGDYTIEVRAANNFGNSSSHTYAITVADNPTNVQVTAAEDIWLHTANYSEVAEAELPSFLGAYDQLTAHLELSCPDGGCGEWDRKASIEAKGHDGEWYEIIRYITPYGVPCAHSIDLTDYMSILQGKVLLRFNCQTFDNGFTYKLTLDYHQGTPEYLYSYVYKIWHDNYEFGDYTNLQPVEDVDFIFPDDAAAATLKLVSTGHGWGSNNTGNAAEFYEATHHIWVNDAQTFAQHNWNICNPNPDGCQPQNGTWFYNRAGWCPGSIAPWFDYDMTPFVSAGTVKLGYVFYEDYVDLCHPNHPDCITGVTCPDCDDGYNPHLIVACNLVVFAGNPIVAIPEKADNSFVLKPNPTSGRLEVRASGESIRQNGYIKLFSITGKLIEQISWDGKSAILDYSHQPKGLYMLMIETASEQEVHKLMIQ